MPHYKMGFRVTHRFTRALGRRRLQRSGEQLLRLRLGSADRSASSATGCCPGTQIAVHRTSDRSIQILRPAERSCKERADGHPLSLDVIATLEGANNMRDAKSSAIGVLLSKKIAKVAALYVEPLFVVNSNPSDLAADPDNNTAMIGLGARCRIRPAVYLVGEVTPRVGGYQTGRGPGQLRHRGASGRPHLQINISNGSGTTLGQLTRSGVSGDSWFIGFNISRKFF